MDFCKGVFALFSCSAFTRDREVRASALLGSVGALLLFHLLTVEAQGIWWNARGLFTEGAVVHSRPQQPRLKSQPNLGLCVNMGGDDKTCSAWRAQDAKIQRETANIACICLQFCH